MDKRSRHGQKSKNSDQSSVGSAAKHALCGLLISLGAATVALVIVALCSLSRPDPEGLMLPVASVLPYPCAILGGFIACKLHRNSPVMCSMLFCIMTLLLSIALFPVLPSTYEGGLSALSFFIMRGLLLGCCISGGLLGAMSPSVKKRRRRKR